MKLLSYGHYEGGGGYEGDEIGEDHGVQGQEEEAVFS